MMRWKVKKEKGFTLVEVIVVLVLLGVVAAGLSGAIIYGAQHFVFAREANELSQKAQLALARMKREMVDVKSIATASTTTLEYTLASGDVYQIDLSGTAINMQGINPVITAQPLIDGLASGNGGQTFLAYSKVDGSAWTTADVMEELAEIQIIIVVAFPGQPNLTFQTTINPRRTAIATVPRLN